MFRKTTHSIILHISIALLALMLLLSACNVTADASTPPPVEAPANPVVTDAPTQAPMDDSSQGTPAVAIDISGVAQGVASQVVPAVPASVDGPWWEAMPQYTLLTLEGYPITDHLFKAQVFVYPVDGLSVNEVASGIPGSLQALLQTKQAGDLMPYLPPYNAGQVMHAQVSYLDFKNGKGVRYLTQFDQAPLPINNREMHYTFQGLTSDGKYYVAAVLPVTLPDLPATEFVSDSQPPYMEDFPAYLARTVDMLNGQSPNAFTPDLSLLDAMMASLEIK